MSDDKDSAAKDTPEERDEDSTPDGDEAQAKPHEGEGEPEEPAGEGDDEPEEPADEGEGEPEEPADEGEGEPEEPADEGPEPEDEEDETLEADPLASADDEIDPELLALGEEGPERGKWHRPVVMLAVLVLIGVMMFWFRAELGYFFSPTEAVELGEAHDAELGAELENRFVRFDGIPLAPRNLNPSGRCGQIQGFPTYQRRFLCRGHQSAIPMMGRPGHDLVVQRFLVRQLRVSYIVPDDQRESALERAEHAVSRVSAIRNIRRTGPDEIGQLIVEVQGQSGRTDVQAVMDSVEFQLEAGVPNVRSIRVERVNRDAPGAFEGRVVRIDNLGSRFAAVREYFNECTDFDLDESAYVVLDGSEAGDGLFGGAEMCYGQAPRQYWPYLLLYAVLVSLFVLNLVLLARFFRSMSKK